MESLYWVSVVCVCVCVLCILVSLTTIRNNVLNSIAEQLLASVLKLFSHRAKISLFYSKSEHYCIFCHLKCYDQIQSIQSFIQRCHTNTHTRHTAPNQTNRVKCIRQNNEAHMDMKLNKVERMHSKEQKIEQQKKFLQNQTMWNKQPGELLKKFI